jgi:hypothetical protein
MTTVTARQTRWGLLRGDAILWELSEPVPDGDGGTTSHVITSRIAFGETRETYIFPADEGGNVTSWGEMSGSLRGEWEHEDAIREAGWRVIP